MIIELTTKSNIEDLLREITSGVNRKYIVNNEPKNKLDKIVFTSYLFHSKQNKIPFIEVKYDFGRRSKRLEIVFKENTTITICKITNINEFDKDYLELNTVLENMRTKPIFMNHNFNGILVFTNDYNRAVVESFLIRQQVYFNHLSISEI